MARKRVLILGGGPGGVVVANNIVREASRVERGLGLPELLSIMRSPEVETALRAFTSFMKCGG